MAAFANFDRHDQNVVHAQGFRVQLARLRAVAREQFALEDERLGKPKTRILLDCVNVQQDGLHTRATFVRKDREEPLPWQ